MHRNSGSRNRKRGIARHSPTSQWRSFERDSDRLAARRALLTDPGCPPRPMGLRSHCPAPSGPPTTAMPHLARGDLTAALGVIGNRRATRVSFLMHLGTYGGASSIRQVRRNRRGAIEPIANERRTHVRVSLPGCYRQEGGKSRTPKAQEAAVLITVDRRLLLANSRALSLCCHRENGHHCDRRHVFERCNCTKEMRRETARRSALQRLGALGWTWSVLSRPSSAA